MVSSGALDWASPAVAPQPRSRDLVQSPLDDSFIAGSTSKELDPGNWDLQQAEVNPIANDVGDLYSFGAYDAATDHQYAFIGFERAAVGGSIAFNLELNQKRNTTNQNGVSAPNRSVGDILVDILASSGSSLIFGDVHTWTGREWDPMPGATGIVGAVNTAAITDVDGNTLPAGRFAELSIDLTALFPDVGSCPGISLQATNLRSRSSGSSITSTLKDWVDPGTITTPTSCGELHIRKRDENGELVPGASFSVSPNPLSPSGPNPFGVLDGGPNDPDGTADGRIDFGKVRPGSYTVTESAPPAGYIGDPAAQTKPVTTGNITTFTYVNRLGTVSWEKVDGVSGAHICCATFSLVKNNPPAQSFPGGIVDNGPFDTDPRDGFVKVEGLKTGSWTLTETAPPTNYALPTPVPTHTFTISAAHPNEVVVAPIQDPRLPGRITIVKTDATSGAPIDATFQLWRDNGDGAFNTPPGSDTPIGPPQSTTGGRLVYPDLDWGTYWVEETVPPTGYTIDPGSPFQVVVSAADRTMTVDVADPRVLSELSVEKLDETDGAPLAGAQFQLFHDLNPVGPDAGDDQVGTCTTSLPTGTCAVSDLDFGRYYWKETQAPPGYDLPADVFSDPVTINAGNAGTTLPVRTFTDPRSLSRLVVEKLDATNQAPLDGAEFTLWLDADGNGGPPTAADTSIDSCTTGANGHCAVENLDFGTYYWEETAAPTGYQLPVDVFSASITVDTTNAGTTLPVRSFDDPRILSELTVHKVDATDNAPLAGGSLRALPRRGPDRSGRG